MDERIKRNEERLFQRDGFLADPQVATPVEVQRIIGAMTVSEYDGRLANMACHVLCARTNLMPRVQSLLGLGFNYCLRKPVVDMDVEKTMSRLRNDIRRNYFFANRVEEIEEDEGRYIPELYIKSVWDAPVANKEVESRMDDFEKRLVHLNKSHRKYVGTNLSPSQQRTCDEIRASNAYRAWPSDKNLGPSWCETELYTERGITDHLGNDRAYRLLTEALARSRMIKLGYDYRSFIMRNSDSLSEAESTFLWRTCRECGPKLSRFYLTAKVHKTPWATRPVVSTCGTMMAGLSKWLDYWLQKLRSQVHSYLQDSSHLLRLLNEFGQLPPGARLFTADAVGIYTNTDTTPSFSISVNGLLLIVVFLYRIIKIHPFHTNGCIINAQGPPQQKKKSIYVARAPTMCHLFMC